MKYTCEICGRTYPTAQECAAHEEICTNQHKAALDMRDTINEMVEDAATYKIIFCVSNAGDDDYKIAGAEYDAAKKAVIVRLAYE